jgi:hypothetical protein
VSGWRLSRPPSAATPMTNVIILTDADYATVAAAIASRRRWTKKGGQSDGEVLAAICRSYKAHSSSVVKPGRKPLLKKVCQWKCCGVEFETANFRRKYHSNECRLQDRAVLDAENKRRARRGG